MCLGNKRKHLSYFSLIRDVNIRYYTILFVLLEIYKFNLIVFPFVQQNGAEVKAGTDAVIVV